MNILKKLFERDDVGIELGSANMRVWVRGKGPAGATGLPVRVADDPAHATIRGVAVILDELDFLSNKARCR